MNGLHLSVTSHRSEAETSNPRASARLSRTMKSSSTSSAQMADTVELLKRRCADELGSAMADSVLSSYTRLMEWISGERLRRLPTEGSAWDKVLGWAQAFGEKFNDFDLAIEEFTGGNYDGAEVAFGYCILLLELGEENAPALQTSFGFFFQRSLDLIALLDRAELFNASSDITDQLLFAYADLVTLVSDIALRFYQVIRGDSSAEVSIDIYTAFASTIDSFQQRRARIVESMWSHSLSQSGTDQSKIVTIQTLRSWLSVDDSVLKFKLGDHTSLVNERQQLTCLWMTPYLTRHLNSKRDCLTIAGGLGSGKSVLAGTIVDMLQKTATRRSYSVIFVPVDARVNAYATSLYVARSILFQLLEQRVGNVEHYRVLADAYITAQKTKDPATYENILWTAIGQLIEHTLAGAKDTILVVDGVDEVSEDPKHGQALLQRLKAVSTKHDKVKLIVLSQPSALAPNTKPDVDITPDLIYDDIFAVVSSLMVRSPHFTSRSQIEQDILVDKIVTASKGSFLWSRMVAKSLVMENSAEKLNQAVEAMKKSPKSIEDVIQESIATSGLTDEGKLLVYWLTIAERPLMVDELATLNSIDPRRGTVADSPKDVIVSLRSAASVVFLQNGLLYLRHSIIRRTLTTWFDHNRPVKDPMYDFVLRLLTYLKYSIREQRDPTFTSMDPSLVEQRFHQAPLIEYAVRYWPKHYMNLSPKVREISAETKKELANVIPVSPSTALIETLTWTWFPTPINISWHTTSIDMRRKVLGSNHPVVLQSVINLARIFQVIEDYSSAASYFYLATQFSLQIYSNTHPLTIQCANHFLEVTSSTKFSSRTEIVSHREEVLNILIESYKKQNGASSEKVINLQKLLIQLYRSIKEEQKATETEKTIQVDESQDVVGGGARSTGGSLGVRVRSGRSKTLDHEEWDFAESDTDTAVQVDSWKRIDELLRLARSQKDMAKAEQNYAEAWYYMSVHSKSSSSMETHLKKIDLAVAFAEFLRSAKRETESAALLTGVWEEYQNLSISRTEQVNDKMIEIAKVMKSVGLTTVALNVFKHCSAVLQTLNKTQSSSYKEVRELEQATHREMMQQASSSSAFASQVSEEIITEIFTSLESSKATQLDTTSVSAIRQVVSTYVTQHRYKECTSVTKRTLQTIWPSFFAASIEDVTQPTSNPDFAIEMAEQLIVCYRYRHRYSKSLEYRERLYRALKASRKLDDQVVAHSITELFKLYEQTRAIDKTTQLHRELLEDYKKFYGPNHAKVIETLFILAKITSPEPVSVEYYRQIVNILSKDSDTCHADAVEPLGLVASHYWNERRYPGAIWAYSLLFRTYVKKGKELKQFHDAGFVAAIYNRYVASLRATTTDIATLYELTAQYRKACADHFGATHKVTIDATMYLARICEHTKRYQGEAVSLYEQLLKQSAASEYHAEIRQTLEAIHEEQSLEAARSLTVSASSEQVDKALAIIRQRVTKTRSQFGWAHSESLEQLREIAQLYLKQSKKEAAHKELTEATRQIITTETSSAALMRSASTVAASYTSMSETHRALEMAEELRWQLVTKDSSNAKKYDVDVTSSGRSAAIYIAQLEYSLRQDSSVTFNEVYISILTEIVYYEDFQRAMKSNLSLEAVFRVAARLHAFLDLHRRTVMKNHVENELISFFLRTSGEKGKVGDVAQVRVLVITMLEYINAHEVKDFVHSISLASIARVRLLLQENEPKEACDLAQTAFRYVHAVGGYKNASAIKYGLILAMAIADIHNTNTALRPARIQIAGDIVRTILRAAQGIKMSLAGVPLRQTNIFVTILGEEKDYVTLEWFLTALWEARETHRAWKPAVVLELGYRLVLARFLLGKHDMALQLATDMAYNLRRVYGSNHLATLEVNVLLGQLCVSTGLAFQAQKGAEDMARRYYKRAAGVHESVLRSLTLDPLGLGEEDDITVMSTDPEPMDLSVVVDKDATQGTYARKHLHLLKLALQRFGGYPKAREEYEAINADVFHAYADDLEGVKAIDQWEVEKFGHGKTSESDEKGTLDTDVTRWSLTDRELDEGRQSLYSDTRQSLGVGQQRQQNSRPRQNGHDRYVGVNGNVAA